MSSPSLERIAQHHNASNGANGHLAASSPAQHLRYVPLSHKQVIELLTFRSRSLSLYGLLYGSTLLFLTLVYWCSIPGTPSTPRTILQNEIGYHVSRHAHSTLTVQYSSSGTSLRDAGYRIFWQKGAAQ